MREPLSLKAQAKAAAAAILIVALVGITTPLALADSVGAPTSAAGGVSAPSSPSRPSAAGPQGGTSGSSAYGGGGSSIHEDYEPLKLAPAPGTGKFEGPNNGTKTPCIGTTGFGSSGGVPGRGC